MVSYHICLCHGPTSLPSDMLHLSLKCMFCVNHVLNVCTVKPRFTGPLRGKEKGTVKRRAWYRYRDTVYINLHKKVCYQGGLKAQYIEELGKSGHGKSEFFCLSFQFIFCVVNAVVLFNKSASNPR